jgi:hypothetical protein
MDLIGLGPVFTLVNSVLDKIFPDPEKKAAAQLELLKLQQTGELAQLASVTDLAKGQLSVNEAEAGNASTFVSGWRPFVGWVCGVGLAYSAVLEPLARFIAAVKFGYQGSFPPIDTTITMQILMGMLGLGAMRSYDKKNGV